MAWEVPFVNGNGIRPLLEPWSHGWDKWYVWVILIVAVAVWLIITDQRMKSEGGEGFLEGLWDGFEIPSFTDMWEEVKSWFKWD